MAQHKTIEHKFINEPFTPEQVRQLNEWQKRLNFHPFTCGNNSNHRLLKATIDGWVCPDCDYTQDWAHGFMVSSGGK